MFSVLNSAAATAALPTATLTMQDYRATIDAIETRSRELMLQHRGQLQSHTAAWKDILMLAYMRAYLQRPCFIPFD